MPPNQFKRAQNPLIPAVLEVPSQINSMNRIKCKIGAKSVSFSEFPSAQKRFPALMCLTNARQSLSLSGRERAVLSRAGCEFTGVGCLSWGRECMQIRHRIYICANIAQSIFDRIASWKFHIGAGKIVFYMSPVLENTKGRRCDGCVDNCGALWVRFERQRG